ncbi:MAG TPA: carbonic anhydrase family protein [Candidatus Polarisedimenticolaceae bacterium]|nr:carbonic anhydrase family protein [Candidatus Polarisedimenticolaceae bacterium]
MRYVARFAVLLMPALAMAAEHHGKEAPHFTYEGAEGPEHWGDLDPSFQACKLGKLQSPIDIPASTLKPSALDPITFDYKPSPLKITDNGHTVMATYAPGSVIHVGPQTYELQQIHFHRPSEETIDGKPHAMVAHLVHKNKDGKLAVVAVLFDEGAANPAVHKIFSHIPSEKGKESLVFGETIDAKNLLPATKSYFTFMGSLTTPPCSEGVRWFVLGTSATVTHQQIETFAKHYPHNARPTQALGGREIKESQ